MGSLDTRCSVTSPEIRKCGAPVKHGVESRHFVNAHGWHFQELRDVVHDADTRPSLVLSLTEMEEGDDSTLLVLWGIPGYDFVRFLQVVRGKLEWYLRSKNVCMGCLGAGT